MNKKILVGLFLFIILLFVGRWAITYFALFQSIPTSQELVKRIDNSLEDIGNSSSSTVPVETKVEEVASGLFVPWSIVFSTSDRMLVTERNGKVRIIENGSLQAQPLHTFANVSQQSEEGLMGMAMDPEYQKNKYLYFCYAGQQGNEMNARVVRLTDQGSSLTDETVILDNIPAAQYHAGCRVKFGPDGKLYVTTGDATDKNIAQDMNSLGGKVLRLNADGSIPSDNPFPNSPVYSLGHRNPQGIDWHPLTGQLFETEHGPSLFDGPAGGDEVNLIEAGKNYGWPIVSHEKSKDGLVDPLIVYTPAVAPASGMFYKSSTFPQWTNHFFFGGLKGEGIFILHVESGEVVQYEKMAGIDVGRVREITEGPDGSIYFSTSNRDSRGDVNPGDDKIFRVVPR